MRYLTTVAFSLLPALAWADGWRVGNELITEGDTMPEVRQAAGPPDQANRIESPEGGTVGYRWYYTFEGYNERTVVITFSGGRVVNIETYLDE